MNAEKPRSIKSFFGDLESKERESMCPESWGTGRPRGDCTKNNSLFYIKVDKYPLSEIRFQR